MGTNYYLYSKPPCSCCGRPYEPLHIGKSSGGWCFALHVIPEEGINDLEDWRVLWSQPGARIENEYGTQLNFVQMDDVVTQRCWPRDFAADPSWVRRNGYVTEEVLHIRNQSQRGPNGLLRAAIGNSCVKHGEGTWDCIVGEFS